MGTDFVYSRSGPTITTPDGRTVPNGGWYNDATTLTGSVRADNEGLTYNNSPLRNSWDLANAGWISRQRYHGMYRNPETQVPRTGFPPKRYDSLTVQTMTLVLTYFNVIK